MCRIGHYWKTWLALGGGDFEIASNKSFFDRVSFIKLVAEDKRVVVFDRSFEFDKMQDCKSQISSLNGTRVLSDMSTEF